MMETEEEKTFHDSIKKEVSDLVTLRNSPGDTVWDSVVNVFSRRRPLRFFDIFVIGSFLVLILLLSFAIIRSFFE